MVIGFLKRASPIGLGAIPLLLFLGGCATVPGKTKTDQIQTVDQLIETTLADLVSQNPAEAVYLQDRGKIAVGLLADLACVETEPHRRVRGTLRHGQPIFWDASMSKRGTLTMVEQR